MRYEPVKGTASGMASGEEPRDLQAGSTSVTNDRLSLRTVSSRNSGSTGVQASLSCQRLPTVPQGESQSRRTGWWKSQPNSASPSIPKQSIELHRLPRTTESPRWSTPATGRGAEKHSFVAVNQFADNPAEENDFDDTPTDGLEYPKSIELTVGEFRAIRIGGWESAYANVTGFSQSDQGVCEAMVSGRTKLHVIGAAEGTTQLTVSAEVGGREPRSMDCEISIRVKNPDEKVDARLLAQMDAIERAVSKAFPNCQVKIAAVSKRIVVSGMCDSKDSRDMIIDLVRGICLTWVEDRLETPHLEHELLIYPDKDLPSCLGENSIFPGLQNDHLSN